MTTRLPDAAITSSVCKPDELGWGAGVAVGEGVTSSAIDQILMSGSQRF